MHLTCPQLLNGGSRNSPPLLPNGTTTTATGRYCGSSAPTGLETSSNHLTVNFVSDASGSGSGFSLVFSEVSVTCGGTEMRVWGGGRRGLGDSVLKASDSGKSFSLVCAGISISCGLEVEKKLEGKEGVCVISLRQ